MIGTLQSVQASQCREMVATGPAYGEPRGLNDAAWLSARWPLAQALHYQFSRFTTNFGIHAHVIMRVSLDRLPTAERYASCRQGEPEGRRQALREIARVGCTAPITNFLVYFSRDPEPNPVALRAVRLTLDSVIGTQPDAGSARRALRQAVARLHPDKTGYLHLTELQQLGAQDCLETLAALRDIMRHEECAQMLYQPGRLAYGRFNWRKLAASAALAGACSGILFFCPVPGSRR